MTKNTLGALAPGGYTRTQNTRTARAMVHSCANCLRSPRPAPFAAASCHSAARSASWQLATRL
eukprot:8068-Prymnesium_polylepis.1